LAGQGGGIDWLRTKQHMHGCKWKGHMSAKRDGVYGDPTLYLADFSEYWT